MLKYACTIFLIVFLSSKNYAQSRYYLGQDNEITNDSTKASSYILIEQDKATLLWKMRQYTLDDTLALTGSYKDSQLKIPHGKFTVYFKGMKARKIGYNVDQHRIDTIIIPVRNYIVTIGSFLDGNKDGEWAYYLDNGHVEFTKTYRNGKLNGITKKYDGNTQKMVNEGHYIDDMKEGAWLTFSETGAILKEEIYKNDKIIKTVDHSNEKQFKRKIRGGKPGYSFQHYLDKALKGLNLANINGQFSLYFIINKEGKLISPGYAGIEGIPDVIVVKIIEASMNAPAWGLVYVNDVVSENISVFIQLSIADEDLRVLRITGPSGSS